MTVYRHSKNSEQYYTNRTLNNPTVDRDNALQNRLPSESMSSYQENFTDKFTTVLIVFFFIDFISEIYHYNKWLLTNHIIHKHSLPHNSLNDMVTNR